MAKGKSRYFHTKAIGRGEWNLARPKLSDVGRKLVGPRTREDGWQNAPLEGSGSAVAATASVIHSGWTDTGRKLCREPGLRAVDCWGRRVYWSGEDFSFTTPSFHQHNWKGKGSRQDARTISISSPLWFCVVAERGDTAASGKHGPHGLLRKTHGP